MDDAAAGWLRCDGEMARRVRGHDWAATAMGPMDAWPQALKFALNLLLPSSAQMVLFWGPELRAFYNDAYAPTIGNKHPWVLGRPASEGWAELWDDLGPLLRSVLERGETVSASDRPFRIDRAGYLEEVFFDISYSPVRGPQGEVEGVLCMVAETTGRVLALRRLADSEAGLRAAAERIELALNAGAVAGTWLWEVPADRFTADERFARTFAIPPASLAAGMPIEEVKQSIHPEDIAHVNVLLRLALARGGPFRAEYRVRQMSGGWRWIEANGHVELDADGHPARFPGVLVDIDRRREAEETLRASEARFRALAQALPNQVWTADADGRLDWLNERVGAYSGLTLADLAGAGWAALVPADEAERVRRSWHDAVARGAAWETEFRIRRHDGQWRWHLVRAIPVQGDGRAGPGRQRWVGANTDIHDHKAAQATLANLNEMLEQRVQERTRDLRETQARLHQSQKMEALGQLTGGIAHDFNNLLQGITGAVEVMRRRARSGDLAQVERFADSALQSARRAAALIHRLLAFARRQALAPRAVHVDRLVVSMEDLLRRTLGENVALHIETDPRTWVARCDENQLESAILNLAINARDAMPGGGRLAISTANVVLPPAAGDEADPIPAGEYAAVTVADTGTGMDEALLARVFEPFFTTKPQGQGTGLGLSMIYGFARQSGGGVRLASRPGEGTTATLFLPRLREDAPGARTDELAEPPQGGGEIVMVVEDDASVRLLVLDLLQELGYRTLESADGAAALALLQQEGRVDLLVSDVGLPGMNGRQLAERAQQLRPGLPVLLMSGYAPPQGEDGAAAGIEVLAKPFPMSTLATKVQEIMDRRRSQGPSAPPAPAAG